MAKKQKAYDEVTSIAEFKQDLLAYPQYTDTLFLTKDTLAMALTGLNNSTPEKEKDFLTFMHYVDSRLSMPGLANCNRFHKIPVILAGSIYINYYPETIADLTLEELRLLATYSVVEPPYFYPTATALVNKELLSAVINKTQECSYQTDFLEIAISKIKHGAPREEVIADFNETPLEKLEEESQAHTEEMFKEIAKYL